MLNEQTLSAAEAEQVNKLLRSEAPAALRSDLSPVPPAQQQQESTRSDLDGEYIGIDLGTSYCCVAVWNWAQNRVEIIPNEQGDRVTPAHVAFVEGNLMFGDAAKSHAPMNASNTLSHTKRLLGCGFPEAAALAQAQHWPFALESSPLHAQRPMISVQTGGDQSTTLAIQQAVALTLAHAKATAEAFLRCASGTLWCQCPAPAATLKWRLFRTPAPSLG